MAEIGKAVHDHELVAKSETSAATDAPSSDELLDEAFVLLTDFKSVGIPFHPQHVRKLARKGLFPKLVKIGARDGKGGRTAARRRDLILWARQQQ